MTELTHLVASLKKNEIKVIKQSFLILKNNKSADTELLEKFFDLLSNDPDISNKEICKQLLLSAPGKALTQLKIRLFHYILDVMISDDILLDESILDPDDRRSIRLRKKMVQYRALYRRKNSADRTVVNLLLNEIIKEAREIEQFDVLTEALMFKKFSIMFREGLDQIKQVKEQMEHSNYSYMAVLTANDHYYHIIVNPAFKIKNTPARQLKKLGKAIAELEVLKQKSGSALLNYIYNLLRLEELQQREEYEKGIIVCNDTINLLKKNPFIGQKGRLAFIYDQLSICHVKLEKFEKSIDYAIRAKEYSEFGSPAFLVSAQYEFFACFYAGRYQGALLLSNKLLDYPVANAGDFRYEKHILFKAYSLLQLHKYEEALHVCNKALKNNSGSRWDIGIFYVTIISNLLLDKKKDAFQCIKELNIISKRLTIAPDERDKLILKLLLSLAAKDFITTSPAIKQILKQLSANNSKYSWRCYTHELIPIQDQLK